MSAITKETLPTYLELLNVVMEQIFNKENQPSAINDKSRYPLDITFLPLKLTQTEAGFVEGLFNHSPLEAKSTSNPEPVPNDLYRLKLTLLLTEIFHKGLTLTMVEIMNDKTRRDKLTTFAENLTQDIKNDLGIKLV